ncbi:MULTISPECIES: dUTP diphosphatase [unclassified Paracoccus (in: a-proteobacteria)]|uniref:dUTP diphosphatase n=1 Tax=unclassified Paracoccus (in: a-proteobacteria) TaxID=2688777 RepID=UPI0016006AFE|nr:MULTISPECIES: dUTP diphosphatase [unclassified Paracoccus (in: a-proteobacteria)]MBB1491599.1 dUTP diphosphatase [Paracoccus sp. MC1854]MBB1498274.1 dUTP diphosphatase [Paracoccus sp. MC1862]QQO44962.1 dUTP diphosphatase [Paracoccus sp. MC1862]
MHPLSPAVELKLLDPRLRDWGMPSYQTPMAAALDLHACLDAPLILHPQAPAELVPSGIALHMADPHLAALILPRSGLGHRRGLVMGNAVGLIDADYTEQIFISAWNRNPPGTEPILIQPGERIAQMLFVPVVRPMLVEVAEFTRDSDRRGGFGSTGV